MVIDSSALIAILLAETDAAIFEAAAYAAPVRIIGAPTLLETAMVMIGRLGPTGRDALDGFVAAVAADVAPFTPSQATRAINAFLRYGKGRHPAGLNFGDCCSYALAAEINLPLLFKGSDFSRTDIVAAIGRWAAAGRRRIVVPAGSGRRVRRPRISSLARRAMLAAQENHTDSMIDVTIPVEPEAAAVLADPRNREAVGRLVSRVRRPR